MALIGRMVILYIALTRHLLLGTRTATAWLTYLRQKNYSSLFANTNLYMLFIPAFMPAAETPIFRNLTTQMEYVSGYQILMYVFATYTTRVKLVAELHQAESPKIAQDLIHAKTVAIAWTTTLTATSVAAQ